MATRGSEGRDVHEQQVALLEERNERQGTVQARASERLSLRMWRDGNLMGMRCAGVRNGGPRGGGKSGERS